jgi:hypothetical protein
MKQVGKIQILVRLYTTDQKASNTQLRPLRKPARGNRTAACMSCPSCHPIHHNHAMINSCPSSRSIKHALRSSLAQRHADTLGRGALVAPPDPAFAMPALPIVILLAFPSRRSRCGLIWLSTRTLPPRFIRRACPGVKDLEPPTKDESLLLRREDDGEQVMGGDRRRSTLPRRWREMPLVELASGPE